MPPHTTSVMAGRGSSLPAIILTLAASSFVMAFFCWLSPREADDIIYAAGLSMPSLTSVGQPVSATAPPSSLADLLRLQWQEYLQWNGRFIGQFLARCLLLAPDWLHAVLTPLVHTALLFFSLLLLWGKRWRKRLVPWQIILLGGLLWFMLPAFGSAFFWRTGTANYGYTLLLAVLFLLPYRFWLDGSLSRLPGEAAFLLAGLLAGWSNESLGMLLILLALGACVVQKKACRSGLWQVWQEPWPAGWRSSPHRATWPVPPHWDRDWSRWPPGKLSIASSSSGAPSSWSCCRFTCWIWGSSFACTVAGSCPGISGCPPCSCS